MTNSEQQHYRLIKDTVSVTTPLTEHDEGMIWRFTPKPGLPEHWFYSHRNGYSIMDAAPDRETEQLHAFPVHISLTLEEGQEIPTMHVDIAGNNARTSTVHGWFVVHENLRHLTCAPLDDPLQDLQGELSDWNAWLAGDLFGIQAVTLCPSCEHPAPATGRDKYGPIFGYRGKKHAIDMIKNELGGLFTGEIIPLKQLQP